MAAKVIDGKEFAASVRAQVAEQVSKLKDEHNIIPGLAVVLVGEDAASQVYVRNKHASTLEVGMNSYEHRLSADTTESGLLKLINDLARPMAKIAQLKRRIKRSLILCWMRLACVAQKAS